MFKKILPWYLLTLVVISLAFIYGCGANPTGGGGGGGISGRQYYGMDSSGDTVKITVNNTAFSVNFVSGTMEGITFSGRLTLEASGILSLETTSSSNPTRIPTGEIAYAYEITNEVLVMGGGPDPYGTLLICPALSSTPPSDGTLEGIMIPWTNWDSMLMACMTSEITGSPGPYTFDMTVYDAAGGYLDHTSEAGYSFTGGRLFKDINHPQMFVSPKGMFVGISGKYNGEWVDGGFAGAMYDATVATEELTDAGNEVYKGIAFERAGGASAVRAVIAQATAPSSGLITVSSMDVSSGDPTGDPLGTAEVGAMNDPAQGLIDINFATDLANYPAKAVAYKYNDSGKYAICGFVSIESAAMSFFVVEQ